MQIKTNQERTDEINKAISEEMTIHNIPDTFENRISMLEGLRDAWLEDEKDLPSEVKLEKSMYLLALALELVSLHRRIIQKRIGE